MANKITPVRYSIRRMHRVGARMLGTRDLTIRSVVAAYCPGSMPAAAIKSVRVSTCKGALRTSVCLKLRATPFMSCVLLLRSGSRIGSVELLQLEESAPAVQHARHTANLQLDCGQRRSEGANSLPAGGRRRVRPSSFPARGPRDNEGQSLLHFYSIGMCIRASHRPPRRLAVHLPGRQPASR